GIKTQTAHHTIVTTCWDTSQGQKHGESREKQLNEKFFKPLLRLQANMVHFNNKPQTATILERILRLEKERKVLFLQTALGGFIERFPHLKVLRLDLQGTWCSLCNTSNAVKLPYTHDQHIVYSNGVGLSIHYGRVLHRLGSLEEVHISVNFRGSTLPIPGITVEKDNTMWSGECCDCMQLLYDDTTFLRQWIDRKNGNVPEGTKYTAYSRPAKLRSVHWQLWHKDDEAGDDDDSADWSSSGEEGEFLAILSSPQS
ncbi:hypothetical protein CVT24_006983, partial [Panaeolus cyanescens]